MRRKELSLYKCNLLGGKINTVLFESLHTRKLVAFWELLSKLTVYMQTYTCVSTRAKNGIPRNSRHGGKTNKMAASLLLSLLA